MLFLSHPISSSFLGNTELSNDVVGAYSLEYRRRVFKKFDLVVLKKNNVNLIKEDGARLKDGG